MAVAKAIVARMVGSTMIQFDDGQFGAPPSSSRRSSSSSSSVTGTT
jgi:hypothetical protein